MKTLEENLPVSFQTPLIRALNLEKIIGAKKIYLKMEGLNPTGTQKDRVAVLHVLNAFKNGFETVTTGSCGNYGASLAYFANKFGLKAVIFVPASYSFTRVNEMRSWGAEVIKINGSYERAVEKSKLASKRNKWYDANPGSVNREVSYIGYSAIALEIFRDLKHSPSAVFVPVGNGTTLAGIYFGFLELYRVNLTDNLPCFVASSTTGGNPIVKSFKLGFKRVKDLDPCEVRETIVNEPLVSYHSYDGEFALKALYKTEGEVESVSDEEMILYSKLLMKTEGLNVLPASASTIKALKSFISLKKLNGDYILVLTGDGSLWKRHWY